MTPTLFPKTDINFYILANNSVALEPWNKTTYKLRPATKNIEERIIKRRNLSFESYEKAIQGARKRLSLGVKHQVTLSTLNFHLSAENSYKEDNKRKRKQNSSLPRTKRSVHHSQQEPKPLEPHMIAADSMGNRGLTNTLRHTNLLRLKQEHQNRVR